MSKDIQKEFNAPKRILMGAGPSNVNPQVIKAMSSNILGHLDPSFLGCLEDVVAMLRTTFNTKNRLTLAISGTGSAGMESALSNVLEPEDKIIIGQNGYFSERMTEMASRLGAKPVPVTADWGLPIDPAAIEDALNKNKGTKAIAIVHAETSTGVLQDLKDISYLAKKHSALLIVDAVTSLGGSPVEVDEWGIDICYSATQKCLGCPPGLSPITISDTAESIIKSRKIKPRSWYLDLALVENYWMEHSYHHTAPILMIYALREGLRVILEEGLDNRFKRHEQNAKALINGLNALNLQLVVPENYRTNQITTVSIPDKIDDAKVRSTLLKEYGIEIAVGLGRFRGKAWRIGLMGESCTEENVISLISALENILAKEGHKIEAGSAVAATRNALKQAL